GARETTWRMQAAVHMNHQRAASPLMQVIDVLGDQRELRHPPRQLDNGPMCRIGLRLQHLHAPPLVPAPDHRRITTKRLGRGQLGWIEALPQPAQRIAKGGNVAFRRDTSSGEDHQMLHGLQRGQGFGWKSERLVCVQFDYRCISYWLEHCRSECCALYRIALGWAPDEAGADRGWRCVVSSLFAHHLSQRRRQ